MAETAGPPPWQRLLTVAALLAASALVGRAIVAHGGLRAALEGLAACGPAGAAAFVLLYCAACVLFIPASILTLGAGAVYGLARGLPLVWASATLGATAAFLLGRTIARGWVQSHVERDARLKAVDRAVARDGWKIVLLTRLSPAFPFSLLNYLFGVTRVPLRDYVLASWAGMLPGTALYVYIGALAGDLAGIGSRGAERAPLEWLFYGVGLAATLAATVIVTRIARKALAASADSPGKS